MFRGPAPREIEHRGVPGAPEYLRLVRTGEHDEPIILFHALGGRLSGSYLPLISRLPRRRPIYLVLAAQSEPLRSSVVALAERYVEALEHVPAPRVHVCGWSLGGAIAFETARLLERRGRQVGLVALLDTWLNMDLQCGQRRSPAAQRRSDYLRWWYLMKLCAGYVDGAEDEDHAFWDASEANRLALVEAAAVRRTGDLFPALRSSAFARMHQLFESLWMAGESYVPTPMARPVSYFASAQADPATVRHWTAMSPEPSVVMCRGDHNSMMDITNGARLAADVMRFIEPPRMAGDDTGVDRPERQEQLA